jgi:quinol monooxygenase YgiN
MPKHPSKSSSANTKPANDIQAMFGAQIGNPPILTEKKAPPRKPAAAPSRGAGPAKSRRPVAALRSIPDRCCSIAPYFKVASGKLPAFRKLCEQFVAKTRQEPKCLNYGFSFDGHQVHCRESYQDAKGLLAHLANVGPLLEQALKISEIIRLEIHGPGNELAKLRKPLAELKPQFFTLTHGFRR